MYLSPDTSRALHGDISSVLGGCGKGDVRSFYSDLRRNMPRWLTPESFGNALRETARGYSSFTIDEALACLDANIPSAWKRGGEYDTSVWAEFAMQVPYKGGSMQDRISVMHRKQMREIIRNARAEKIPHWLKRLDEESRMRKRSA